MFKGRFQIGEFDPNSTAYADIDNSTVFSEAHQQLSLEARTLFYDLRATWACTRCHDWCTTWMLFVCGYHAAVCATWVPIMLLTSPPCAAVAGSGWQCRATTLSCKKPQTHR